MTDRCAEKLSGSVPTIHRYENTGTVRQWKSWLRSGNCRLAVFLCNSQAPRRRQLYLLPQKQA